MQASRMFLLLIAALALLLLPLASPVTLVAQDGDQPETQPDGDADDGDGDGDNDNDGDADGDENPDGQPDFQKMTPREILDYIDDLHRADSSRGKMKMEIKKENWERTIEMEYWTKGKTKSLFRILAPARERNMATLRNGDEMWNYLPRTNRTIQLNSAMMGDSWAGSHFTNNDLVKESRMADDYNFEVTFRGKKRGYDVVEITMIPKEDAAVEWGKVRFMINEGDGYQPMFAVYYDENMKEARFFTYHEIQVIDGRRIPTVMRVVPADNRKEFTKITIVEAKYNVDIEDSHFSLRNLRNQ